MFSLLTVHLYLTASPISQTHHQAAAFINVSLSIYYLLIIKFKWSEDKIKKYRICFFGFPVAIGLAFSFVGIPFYTNLILWCNNGGIVYNCMFAFERDASSHTVNTFSYYSLHLHHSTLVARNSGHVSYWYCNSRDGDGLLRCVQN